ncbi:PP2C family protein-serine/threonine phosphatase [Cellvibrio japonicus]|uniref:Serine/threonine protein phosphatase n=1 Tax=Cellvibrio japonicus (strain Ueda107) TaxID=498211 RepID=B3PHF7_CELJU|nr:protein phosphatase 2C domain-containing protein [Cellvibrio japonicus]ACE82877.1 Serine/threonine protein phosphatase [Cellvibrio japonicus Ueda107]QEI12440.1 serine/threonine-protein phosphatase [Cellvibrio japonicus]QEI16013.1 serine/threonine-protein phosphatase [Cellvibrio japonicus]QEI19592.1 serine/threonine-protein phosphatase [Cellvibrio japonicus]
MSSIPGQSSLLWRSYACTDVGTLRVVNEDAILARPEQGLWVVADGMGGHHAGDVASRNIIDAIGALPVFTNLGDGVGAVENALCQVNQQLVQQAQVRGDGSLMGSTAVILIIRGNLGVCLWVGDSRLYHLRDGQLEQLTRDHSQYEELIDLGLVSAQGSGAKKLQRNLITRAVGASAALYVDLNIFRVQSGDSFLLCSDGLYNVVSHEDVIQGLAAVSVEANARYLLSQALLNGAEDNVSLIVVKGTADKALIINNSNTQSDNLEPLYSLIRQLALSYYRQQITAEEYRIQRKQLLDTVELECNRA